MRYREKKDDSQSVDISPLIDMVFILLIFFMVTTTFVKDMNLEINRPTASSATPASSKAIRVYLDKTGEVYIDEQPVKMWVVQSIVRDALKYSTEKSVLVVVDEAVESGKLVDVVDQIKLAGAKDVGVATLAEAG